MTKPLTKQLCFLKSPLNYIGGKYKILSQILPLFPSKSDIFLDLFCGGCNVAINVNSKLNNTSKLPQADKIICNDNLIYLIDFYQFLQKENTESILEQIHLTIKQYDLTLQNIQGYNALRVDYNHNKSPLLLFVHIAFSFNHQIRFNNAHHFNTPFGKNRSSFNEKMKNNLIAFSKALKTKNISFLKLDFLEALKAVKLTQNSFVYADPPYLITQGVYNDGKSGFSGWNKVLESSLLNALNILDSKGIKFALSNVLYHKGKEHTILQNWLKQSPHLYTHYVNFSYKNCNYQSKRADSQEVLITNYNPLKVM